MKFFTIALNYLLCSPVGGIGTSPVAAAAAPAAAAATFLDARPSVASLEQKFVADDSTNNYEDQLVRFILHLFDKNKSFLEDEHLKCMETAHQEDSQDEARQKTKKRPVVVVAPRLYEQNYVNMSNQS